MAAYEVMTSESQERMLAIVTPDDLDRVEEVCRRWEVRAVVGRVTEPRREPGRLRILDGSTARCSATSRPPPCTRRPRSTTGPGPPGDHDARPPTTRPAGRARRLRARPAGPAGRPVVGVPPVRPSALPQHGGRPGATPPSCAWPRPGCRAREPGPGPVHRLQPALVLPRPPAGARPRRWPSRPSTWPASEPARGRGQLPQLRQPRASRGDVAALRGHRRHGRGVPGARASRSSGATSACTTRARGPTSTPRRSSASLGLIDHLPAAPPGIDPRDGAPRPAGGVGRPAEPAVAGRLAAGRSSAGPPRRHAARPRPAPHGRLVGVRRRPGAVVGGRRGDAWCGIHDVSGGGLGVALAEMAVRSGVGLQVAGVWPTIARCSPRPRRGRWSARPTGPSSWPGPARPGGVPGARARPVATGSVVEGLVDVGLVGPPRRGAAARRRSSTSWPRSPAARAPAGVRPRPATATGRRASSRSEHRRSGTFQVAPPRPDPQVGLDRPVVVRPPGGNQVEARPGHQDPALPRRVPPVERLDAGEPCSASSPTDRAESAGPAEAVGVGQRRPPPRGPGQPGDVDGVEPGLGHVRRPPLASYRSKASWTDRPPLRDQGGGEVGTAHALLAPGDVHHFFVGHREPQRRHPLGQGDDCGRAGRPGAGPAPRQRPAVLFDEVDEHVHACLPTAGTRPHTPGRGPHRVSSARGGRPAGRRAVVVGQGHCAATASAASSGSARAGRCRPRRRVGVQVDHRPSEATGRPPVAPAGPNRSVPTVTPRWLAWHGQAAPCGLIVATARARRPPVTTVTNR